MVTRWAVAPGALKTAVSWSFPRAFRAFASCFFDPRSLTAPLEPIGPLPLAITFFPRVSTSCAVAAVVHVTPTFTPPASFFAESDFSLASAQVTALVVAVVVLPAAGAEAPDVDVPAAGEDGAGDVCGGGVAVAITTHE